MWVRDSSAGIGTMTFIDNATGTFAGLGHSIHDSDTGKTLGLLKGEIVPVEITGVEKGSAGAPGELKGRFLTAAAVVILIIKRVAKTGKKGLMDWCITNAMLCGMTVAQIVSMLIA